MGSTSRIVSGSTRDDLGGQVVGVLEDRQAERELGVLDQELADGRQHLLQPAEAELVDLAGPLALAQADDQHLQDARLVGRVEVGVRLDPVQQDDAVGLVGVLVEVDRQADGVGAEDDGVHVGADLDAHRLGRDPVAGQELALAFGGRAAVAPHRGDDERPEAHLLEGVDRRPRDRGDRRDPPAPDADGDRPARRHPLAEPALEDQPADRPRHVGDLRLGDRLADAGDRRE